MTTTVEAPVYLGLFEHESEEWYAARRDGIGSSDISTVLGLSKWNSPYALWAEKQTGISSFEGNRFTEWGQRLEALIADKFAEEHPEYAVQTTGTWHAAGREWQRANPDRLLLDPLNGQDSAPVALLEIKTASRADDWKAGVPNYYRVQAAWQADVMGVDEVWVAVLIGGNDFKAFSLTFDEQELAAYREAGRIFWETYVLGFQQPPIDGSDATLDAIWALTPPIAQNAEPVVLPDDIVAEYRAVKAEAKAVAARDKAIQSLILLQMGDAKQALASDGSKVAAKQEFIEKRISATLVREKHPEIVAEVTAENPVRKLVAARAAKGEE